MTVPVPGTRVPFAYVNFDSSKAQSASSVLAYNCLIIGQMLSTGTATADAVVRVTSAAQAGLLFGYGSHLHAMFLSWFKVNKRTKVYALPMVDAGSPTYAMKSYTFAVSGGQDGAYYLYIGGRRFVIPISTADDTGAEVVTKMVSLVNADPACVMTAAMSATGGETNRIKFTAKNAGVPGNDIDVRFNFREGEVFPTGHTVTAAAGTTAVVGVPDVTTKLLAAIGDEWYQVIVGPYNDATNIDAIEAELEDRFGPERQVDGRYFTCYKGANFAALETYGVARNSKCLVIPHGNGTPSLPWEIAALFGAYAAREGEIDPARPFTGLELHGILPPVVTSRFTRDENDNLLHDGISTWYVDPTGTVRIQRMITTYRLNDASVADNSYLDITTLQTLSYLRYDFRSQILSRYQRAKLASDAVRLPPGQLFMTPTVGKIEAIAIFKGWERRGLVENVEQFIEDMVCRLSDDDETRIDWSISPDLVNPLMVMGVNIAFLLKKVEG